MRKLVRIAIAFSASALFGETKLGEVKVTADRIVADNVTGKLVATGHVCATAHPMKVWSESVRCDGSGLYVFPDPTSVTTCTNDWGHHHWSISGEVEYQSEHYIILRNMWLRALEMPIFWFPYWYYPLDTDYGLRVMPGYTSRWGAFLMTKYLYHLYGSFEEGKVGLNGYTRLDLREKNGVAIGEGLNWQLGDFGRGSFKVYYAWDQDYEHNKYYDANWISEIPFERYGLNLEHRWEVTERDLLRVRAGYYSDSNFNFDFLHIPSMATMFSIRNEMYASSENEFAWEHAENAYLLGLSVCGPLNDFYPGIARLPEFFLEVEPRPLFETPINYESSSRMGYLDRRYAEVGNENTELPYRYRPGPWAHYNAFRLDSYHRLTLPFKVADFLSVVPRVGYRGTYWGESGYEVLDGASRAGTAGDIYRSICEAGVTFSARGQANLDNGFQHIIEPYFDVLTQKADYFGLSKGARPYLYDGIDGSRDWQEQFAGRGRNLPYSWYGFTPGLRNSLYEVDDNGIRRRIFDIDVYCSVQLNDTDYTAGNEFHRLSMNPEDPNYGKEYGYFVPGFRTMWAPDYKSRITLDMEFDPQERSVPFARFRLDRKESDKFNWYFGVRGRNYRWWDYSSVVYMQQMMGDESFNWIHRKFLDAGFEHEICDAIVWSPYIRWDLLESELDEIGAWIDYRIDCLGFRLQVAYEKAYERMDFTYSDNEFSIGFFIYLRAFGDGPAAPLGK